MTKFMVALSVILGLGLVGFVGYAHFSSRPAKSSGVVKAGDVEWTDSWEEASQLSAETGRPILADFTGSDWCPPCMALKEQVFESEVFRKWAARRGLILLELDFPKRKSQPQNIRDQNRALQVQHQIRSYPSILLLDADGKAIGARISGYGGRGPQVWIQKAERTWSSALAG